MSKIIAHTYIIFVLVSLQFFLGHAVVAQSCEESVASIESEVYQNLKAISINNQEQENLKQGVEVAGLMDSLVHYPCSFTRQFDTLNRIMGILDSPDKSFRIFNWSIIHTDGTYTYFAYLVKTSAGGLPSVFRLVDKSDSIAEPKFSVHTKDDWFGCLYYDIIKTEEDKKNYYTLLGWDGNDLFSNKKIIEILTFSRVGEPVFGKNIFQDYEPKIKRVIFEYSQKSSMTLRYNEQKDAIIFDHLAPSKNIYSGHFDYYGSDFSFDAFSFYDGKWHYKSDIDIRNPKPLKKKR